MMRDKLTKALIYESQGFKKDAFIIYKEILDEDPNNMDAKKAMQRILQSRPRVRYNKYMLELFLSENKDDIEKFKRWLVDI